MVCVFGVCVCGGVVGGVGRWCGTGQSAAPRDVPADAAITTPQFWLLWAVLFLNVTAGIGVLGQASPMIQELFPARVTAAAAAGFVGLLSLFNMVGRFSWSSLSDAIGRKTTYAIFFLLGAALYALTPQTSRLARWLCTCWASALS